MDYIWQVSYLVITNSVASHSGLRLEIETVIAYYIIAFLLVNRYKNVFYRYLCDQNRKIFWSIFFYLYVSLLILNLIDEFMDEITPSTLGFICMLIAQMIFSVVIYILIVHSQEEHRKIEQTMLKRQQQKQLEEYASYLEKSEDELRAFRHDYRNMFNSLKISAQEGKVQEVIDKLDKYTQSNLDSQALLKYKDINHIHIKSLKSIIISKLTELYDQKIPYNLECRQDISQLPEGVDELDLVRIIGITCDNAIEESKSMQEKGETPEVQIMFYSDETGEIEYEICNKLRASKLSIKKIQEQGYTTKKNHQGFGLANIKTIENKYPDMSISYNIRDGWFDFYMTIDSEDDE
ncbi:histidine kinase [Lactobacillus hamsteri DSM 5661 = JCM 6256]|uniref:Histidine kinase n=1 Tax=Lactobacillus hamsteri DSM 5661 = JCM 6256 TaxID=1423754 RepID=A0A0R1YB72_9LACO|nr:GHKL domain-containing protein [Lactobacillus hamsteri]KRM38148.1 histidine kinase [Lactobacillus hamsteri DSM 5661 = JCM 6256]